MSRRAEARRKAAGDELRAGPEKCPEELTKSFQGGKTAGNTPRREMLSKCSSPWIIRIQSMRYRLGI